MGRKNERVGEHHVILWAVDELFVTVILHHAIGDPNLLPRLRPGEGNSHPRILKFWHRGFKMIKNKELLYTVAKFQQPTNPRDLTTFHGWYWILKKKIAEIGLALGFIVFSSTTGYS